MASLREIKKKIESTKKTSQITKAMNMVSASKLRKVERQFKAFQPIKAKVKQLLEHVLSTNPEYTHPLLETREIKKIGYILVTSDRGLAGPYNSQVLKYFENLIKDKESNFVIGTIGYKAFSYCKRKNYPLLNNESINSRDDIKFIDFQVMSRAFISLYLEKQVDKIVMIYTDYINTLSQVVREEVLLPVTDLVKDKKKMVSEYIFEPSVEDVIDQLLPIYLENTLYGIILDAKTAEHASRMTAMKNATDNAKEIIRKQNLIYNRARQAQITIELTDIIGGANAVK
ncbi:MAG: ATP synthase F1 subunit gamma [Candidatus Izemoplasmatales bacterium]|jgi:F-type H+-transporting ATPase subunit gamma|nr:ATP synthase F1 subunit gamma [Candidatus Izemoplasmatales bacterium]